MPNAQELHIGDKVREGDDMHCGRVVAIDLQRNEAYVQWHKGYSSWVRLGVIVVMQ